MSKISIYDVVPVPKLADKLVGTSVGGDPEDLTYNFTLGDLLNLFIPNIPGNTLQGVLNFGNTATQNINLTGTVNTTNLTVSATANILNSNLTGQTKITGGLFDRLNSIGTAGQVLTSTGTQVEWYTIPTVIPNLQQVLTAGNTAVNNIILTGNITANNAALLTATISTSLTLLGTVKDGLNSVGTNNQVLSSNVTGVRWINLPVYSATSPLLYNSATGVFSIQQANASQSGYLSSADWITFDGKQTAIILTTTGSSGPSTLVGSTINVPNYTLSGLNGVPQTRTLTINGITFNLSADRSWTIATGVSSVTASSPLFSTGGATPNITIQQSSSTLDGYLSSVDWLTFNSKQALLGGTGLVKSVGGTISYITDNSANWNTAYNDSIVSAAVTGTATKTLTLNQQDGGTITASWSDIDTGLTSVGVSMPAAFSVSNSPLTSNGTIAITGSGNALQYVDGTGALQTFPGLTGFVPYTGATGSVNLGVYSLTATSLIKNGGTSGQFLKADGSVDSSAYIVLGSLSATAPLSYNNTTGAFSISQSGAAADGYLSSIDWNTFNNKQGALTLTTTGSSGASTLIGNTLNIPTYTDQFVGTVTSVAALTLGTIGTDLSSTVANSTTTPVITLNVPTASAVNRGALSAADWTTFDNKQVAGNYITSLTGEATALGPGAAAVTLDNAAVISKVLTGLNVTGGTVVAADSILTGFGKVQNQINGLIGGTIFQGTWNANTNTPALVSSVGTNGHYYIVSVAGTTNLDGITDWQVGDWAIFAGTTWEKVDNTDSVSSVNGFTGAVSLTTDNIPEGATNLYFTNTRARTAISLTTTGSSGASTYDNTTGAFNIPTYTDQFVGTVTSVGLSSVTSGVTIGSTPITTSGTITLAIATATGAQNGLLSSTDWTTFNSKQGAITLTTTGTSGASTLVGNTLNIPNYTDSFVGTVTSVSFTLGATGTNLSASVATSTTTPAITLNVPTASASARGALSSTDWSTFNGKQDAITLTTTGTSGAATLVGATLNIPQYQASGTYVTSVTGTSPIVSSGGTTPAISIPVATTSVNGYLSSTDWTTFNNKQGTITLTTTGTSGAATFSSNTLNIPQYQSVITNPVTGTGTTNYLPKFTAASTIGNSVAYDNGSQIGIGQTTLFVKFSVADSLAATSVGSNYNPGIINIQNTNTTNGNLSLIGFQDASAFINLAAIGSINEVHSGSPNSVKGSLAFYTKPTGSGYITEKMRLDSSGNLGLGVTPSAWNSAYKAFQFGTTGALFGESGDAANYFTTNTFVDSVGFKYITSDWALGYFQENGVHSWRNAPSGTAGNAITFTQAMTLTSGGNLLVGTTTDAGYKLDVNGTGRFSGITTFSSTGGSGLRVYGSSGTNQWDIYLNSTNLRFSDNTGTGSIVFDRPISGTSATFSSTLSSTDLSIKNSANAETIDLFLSPSAFNGFIDYPSSRSLTIRNKANGFGLTLASTGAATFSSTLRATEITAAMPSGNGALYINNSSLSNKNWTFIPQTSSSETDLLLFYTGTGAGTRMTITSGGNVLIGTTTDAGYKLDVNGTGRFSDTTDIIANNSNAINLVLRGRALDSVGQMEFWNNAKSVRYGYIGADSTSIGFVTTQAIPLIFGTNSIERMRITSGGNVGLGVTPSAWNSAYKAFQFGTTGALFGESGDAANYFTTNTFIDSVGFKYITSDWALGYFQENGVHSWRNAPSGTAGNAITFTQAMTLTSGGNLLVGTTTDNGSRFQVTGSNSGNLPLLNLVASGTGTFQRGVRLLNSGMNAGDHIMMSVGQADSARNMGQFYFQYNGSGSTSNRLSLGLHSVDDVLNILGTGNVGIGTTSPTNGKLEIQQSSTTAALWVQTGGTTASYVIADFRTGTNSPALQILGNGNVGIGSTPTFRFDVETSNLTVSRFFSNATGKRNNILLQNSQNFNYGVLGVVSGTGVSTGDVYGLGYSASGSTAFTEVLNWTSTGNVGVNTTSPQFKFNVHDAGANIVSGNAISTSTMKGVKIENTNNGDESIGVWFTTGGNHWSGISGQRNNSASTWGTDLRFYTHEDTTVDLTYARERMRITSGGSVGIGTTTPDANSRLDVNGQAFVARLAVYNDNGTPSLGTSPMFYSPASGTLAISTNASERMRITSGGNVLIGTTTDAGYTLNLVGNAQFIKSTTSTAMVVGLSGVTGSIIRFSYNAGFVGSISTDGSTTAYNTSSDYRLKEQVRPIDNPLEKVMKLNPVNFKYKSSKTVQDGFIAHEIQEILPYLVTGEKDGVEMQEVDYSKLTPILIAAIKEQQKQIEELKNKLP